MKKLLTLLVASLALISLAACGSSKQANHKTADLLSQPIQEQTTTMGTFIQVTVYDKGKEQAAKDSLKIAEQYNDWTTVNDPDSQIDDVNDAAGLKPVAVNPGVYQLVKYGYDYSAKNVGYDITIGALSNLWRIGFPDARKPSQTEINQALPLISYHFIKFDDQKHTIYLTKKGARLDLGSIVKGYVAMLMVEQLKKAGVTTGIVDLGSSSIYVIGHSPRENNAPWRIGIKDPNDPTGTQMGILQAANQHVNTSGIYERFLQVGNVKYSHELNPKTGYPFENDLASITLLISGNDPTNGDGLSTMIYAMGTKKGYEYVEKMKNVQAVFVDKDNRVYITPGLKDKFKITSKNYQIANINDLK